MVKFNEDIINIGDNNTFLSVSTRINEFKKKNPNIELLSLGIGDVTMPIVEPVSFAMHKAVDELSNVESFKGYNSSSGCDFLKEKILKNEYSTFNFSNEEIYISNGTKTDCTSILELFSEDSKICITNAMYPVYRDGAHCLNRKVYYLDANYKNSFMPKVPNEKYDIIYICSPSNPTGMCYSFDALKQWVDYAIKNESIILYDNVYVPFISSKDIPKSIYEIDGAKKVAIEFRSFSKTASFSGVRCSYYIIPNDIDKDINKLWRKRTINRFNGADYIAQRGAEAVYLKESQKLIKNNIDYYKNNIKLLRESFLKMGFEVYGGIDSPYMWVRIKEGIKSWDLFNMYLEKLNVIVIPGIVFGENGDDFFRVSGLGLNSVVLKAIERLENYYGQKK